jgi:membrane protease YdiL (CAAX protease family)
MAIIHYERWSEEELGFRHIYGLSALVRYGAFAILGTLFLIWYAKQLGFQALDVDDLVVSWRLIVFFIPVSVFQEIVYRGFLMPRLGSILKNNVQVVFVNALLFALLHIIYPRPEIMLSLAFVSGLVFAVLYQKYPNIVLISITHAILNFVAVMFGFFTV